MFEDGVLAGIAESAVAGARLDRACALPPGPLAMALLAGTDPAALDAPARVELLQAWERATRWVAAQQLGAIVAVAGPTPTGRDDYAREEVRAALRQVGGGVTTDIDTARALHGPLSRAAQALAAGDLSYPQTRALAQETEPLDPATAAAVCARVVPEGRHRTPADFRRRVRAAVIAADPIGAALRAEQASADRQVTRRVLPDAQAALDITGPAPAVALIWATLTHHAGLTHPDDPRTLDQRRFDALLDICRAPTTDTTLTGVGQPGAGAGRPRRARRSRTGTSAGVFIFADAQTWAGLAEHPAELDGYGPIPAGVARDCFTDSQWRAVITDALTGLVAGVSDTSYTPSPRTRRHLFLTDRGCLFPGCSAPVWYCDAEHSTPYHQGGCTDPDNCGLLCRHHHRLKTFTNWTWQRHPDGTVDWTSPTGRTYTRQPQRYLTGPPRVTEDAPPAPDPSTLPAPTRAGPRGTGYDDTGHDDTGHDGTGHDGIGHDDTGPAGFLGTGSQRSESCPVDSVRVQDTDDLPPF